MKSHVQIFIRLKHRCKDGDCEPKPYSSLRQLRKKSALSMKWTLRGLLITHCPYCGKHLPTEVDILEEFGKTPAPRGDGRVEEEVEAESGAGGGGGGGSRAAKSSSGHDESLMPRGRAARRVVRAQGGDS